MKAIERRLYSRKGHFYYRSAFPKSLHPLLSLKENVIALGSDDLSEARLLVARLHYEEERLLKSFQNRLTEQGQPDLQSLIDELLKGLEELKGTVGYDRLPKTEGAPKPRKASIKAAPPFSEIYRRYLSECASESPRTKFQKEATYTLFVELEGDLPFMKIGPEQAKHFKSCLMKIPANAKKFLNITSFKGVDLDKINIGKPQDTKTINSKLAFLSGLFTWATHAGCYQGQNPFSGLMIREKKNSSTRRHPFNISEIETLFKSPLYAGCKGEKWSERNQKGDKVIKDAIYWVPLVGLYSGMRMNEICQLYVSDIREDRGVFVFDVNDDGDDKSLKTTSSRRIIPIHEALIKKGFLGYITEKKDKNEKRLFSDIEKGAYDSYSSPFSKRFKRLLNAVGVDRQGVCFHSLRHTFIDGLRNAGVERSIVMTLTGHQSSDVHDSYGYGYSAFILKDAINKLSFPCLE